MTRLELITKNAVNQARAQGVNVTPEHALEDLERAANVLTGLLDKDGGDDRDQARVASALSHVHHTIKAIRKEISDRDANKPKDPLQGLTAEQLEALRVRLLGELSKTGTGE